MPKIACSIAAALALLVAPNIAQSREAERRCGWLHNPTPANWWLTDREGDWVLSSQGGPPVPGMDSIPDMTTREWVRTNGHHGHGCACLTIEVEHAPRRVLRVLAATPLPLALCQADRALPRR